MGNIYTVGNWTGGKAYKLNEPAKVGDLYYYAKSAHFSQSTFSVAMWDGITTWNNKTKPYFFWKPSFSSEIPISPKVLEVSFGDGYTKRNPDGINNVLLKLNLNFDLKTNDEATAILHFLHTRGGWEKFVFIPPEPYSSPRLFVCKDWGTTINYVDNYGIKAVFEETAE
jgi:phage-related protein